MPYTITVHLLSQELSNLFEINDLHNRYPYAYQAICDEQKIDIEYHVPNTERDYAVISFLGQEKPRKICEFSNVNPETIELFQVLKDLYFV